MRVKEIEYSWGSGDSELVKGWFLVALLEAINLIIFNNRYVGTKIALFLPNSARKYEFWPFVFSPIQTNLGIVSVENSNVNAPNQLKTEKNRYFSFDSGTLYYLLLLSVLSPYQNSYSLYRELSLPPIINRSDVTNMVCHWKVPPI